MAQDIEGLNRLLRHNERVRELRDDIIPEQIKNILRNESLYRVLSVELVEDLKALYPHTVLLYCVACKAERPFHDSIPLGQKVFPSDEQQMRLFDGVYLYDYQCTGCGVKFCCWLYINFTAQTIEKIGQMPSVADLYSGELTKYRKVLGSKYIEFNRAVGLHAHGVGIGAFVYLRRIFEWLVNEAYDEARTDSAWDESAYQKARMDEKIVLLKNHLPQTLVGNAGMYAILSRGIHSLSEEDCLRYFDTVRLGIELVLDEKIEREERQKKLKRVADELARIKGGQAGE